MAPTKDQQKVISPVNVEKRQEINIQTGDTVRVIEKIDNGGDDFRREPFEGIVLARKHGDEPGGTFTVRSEIEGVGVEKIFPLYSPRIDEINIVRRAQMRRSKLYHIRDKAARQIRRQMRRMVNVDISTKTEDEDEKATQNEEEEGGGESDDDGPADESQDEAHNSESQDEDGEAEEENEPQEDQSDDSEEEKEGEN
jgi:large subunit ribosomal protein L19